MKKMALLTAVMLVVFVASKSIYAASKSEDMASSGLKIAYVDLARALNEVNEGKNAKAKLEREFKTKKTELDGIKNEIESLRTELEKKASVLSQEAMKTERDNYQRKFIEYQQKAKDYTEQLAREEGEATNKIIEKLRIVVEKIAQRDGYTYVLEKSAGGVLYGPSSADITSDVIKDYNK